MLERASTCFESGRRQLLRAATECIHPRPRPRPRPRRALHSSFWHHGASDLDLPIWWAAASALSQTRILPTRASRHSRGFLLDFLYPEKTLALLRCLSDEDARVPVARRRRLISSESRQYSSTWAQPRYDGLDGDAFAADEAAQEMARLLRYSTADAELAKLLHLRPHGQQELAWQLYEACVKSLPEETIRVAQSDFLEYLVQDSEVLIPSRVLHVFDDMPLVDRRSSSYRAAILAYIKLRTVGPAIQMFEEAAADERYDTLNLGVDAILWRTVLDEQWDLALRVFGIFLRHTPEWNGLPPHTYILRGHDVKQLRSEFTDLPYPEENLKSLFGHFHRFQHELTSSTESLKAFLCLVVTFIPSVMDYVLKAHEGDEEFLQSWFLELFSELRSLKLPTSVCYEYAIQTMLERSRGYTHKQPLWRQLYLKYKQQSVYEWKHLNDHIPSRYLITNIIYYYGHETSLKYIDMHVEELRSLYPNKPLRPGLLKFLIRKFAEHGEDTRVLEYLDELQLHHAEQVDLKIVSSLLFVYARRADVAEATVQFRRIQDEFNLTPDTACWNMLLLANVRSEDLDGSLECFNQCIDSGTVPDMHTFGPLLDFCARRGDVEAFETLFARARQMGLPVDTNVRARSGYVQAVLNSGDVQGAETIARGMLEDWKAGTLTGHPLTHTWNLLIQYYALDKDLESSRNCYRDMVENDIPLDSWTFSSLMRALIEVSQTNAAYKILRVTMPLNNLRVHALHHAIVMTGFLREGQIDLAMDAYDWMKRGGIAQTESSRKASIVTLGTFDLIKLRKRGAKHPNYRLLQAEKVLQEILIAGTGREIAHKEPGHSRFPGSHNQAAVPQAYYGLLSSLYTDRSAYRICRQLFRKAEAAATNAVDFTPSLTLLTAMMETHLQNGKHDEVAKCWELAYTSTSKLTKTFHQALHPDAPDSGLDSLIDPTVLERFEESHISNNRRQLLVKPTRLYIRSLLAQPDPSALQEAERTIRNLLIRGFAVDTFVWNEFITIAAQRNDLHKAFTICEAYLMPRFPGWRIMRPSLIVNNVQGYQWMSLRHHQVKKTTVIPRYKTLIVLAQAYNQTLRDERNGVGYIEEKDMWMLQVLREIAPMTIRAIESMPRTNDKLQSRYFRPV